MGLELSTKTLDHLGLVSGMCEELDLVNQIDRYIIQDETERKVSIGTICKALILNGLGFTERTLYMVSSFFEDKPTELLLGAGVESKHLNDSVLGRALDDLQSYGTTKLFSLLTPVIVQKLGLETRYAHLDSTTFHLQGRYNAENPPSQETVLHLTKGYSRDHRPDLNQVVLNMVASNQAGIPLHMEALNGNANDKTTFRETITSHVEGLQNVSGFEYLVFDSAGYTQKNLKENGGKILFISRVPESIKECKELISSNLELQPLEDDYQYCPVCTSYAGVKQRWLLIYSPQAYEREIKTLKKRYLKKSLLEYERIGKLERRAFSCLKDAQRGIKALEKELKTLQIDSFEIREKRIYKGKGRPSKNAPFELEYYLELEVSSPLYLYEKACATKGYFVLATNELEEGKLPDATLFKAYKEQSKVERGFRFLKDPQFVASNFFVKKLERIEALLFIMTLCLTVYAAIEYRIRQLLIIKQLFLPNQLGKDTQKPTARWVFHLFRGIHILYGNEVPIPLNIKEVHLDVVRMMGEGYKKYYLIE